MGDAEPKPATSKVPQRITHQYGTHSLQTLSAWKMPLRKKLSSQPQPIKYWIIYIHGGAWRDPTINNLSFLPTIETLLKPPIESIVLDTVAGFASIDYRLSPHPDHPQDQTTTPASEYRNAKHPDHIEDVESGLELLQETYKFGEDYILVGHSCGATLAFQTVMQQQTTNPTSPRPSAILGACGIYDIPGMLVNQASSPWFQVYKDFVVGAFGTDESVWHQQSPGLYEGFQDWDEGKVVVLAKSINDELIEGEQMDVMEKRLWIAAEKGKLRCVGDLRGSHDGVWRDGVELALVVKVGLEKLLEVWSKEHL